MTYYIVIKHNGVTETFPSGVEGTPTQWDFEKDISFKIPVVSKGNSLYLFNAISDAEQVSGEWRKGSDLIPNGEPNIAALVINAPSHIEPDPENLDGPKIFDYSLRYNFSNKLSGRVDELLNFSKLIIKAKLLSEKPFPVQVAFVTRDGNAYGGFITVQGLSSKDYVLNISDLKPVKLVNLPRPYPGILPYYFGGALPTAPLNMNNIENLQFFIGPGIESSDLQSDFSFALESIRIE